jgi:hypothetical protein
MTPKQPETARDVALREIVAYLKDVDQACGVLSNRAGWNEEAVRLVYAVLDQGLDQYYPDKSRAYDPVRGYASLLSYLRGYAVVRYDCADEVLREAAARLIVEGKPLPPTLRYYVVEEVLRRATSTVARRKTGPNRDINTARDVTIGTAVSRVVEHHGFPQTRNKATRDKAGRDSACSIVADALEEVGIHMSEDAVEKVWHNLVRFVRRPRRRRRKN